MMYGSLRAWPRVQSGLMVHPATFPVGGSPRVPEDPSGCSAGG